MDDAIKPLSFKINNLRSCRMLEGGKAATRKRLNCRFLIPPRELANPLPRLQITSGENRM
jgi:hypothetical protein